MASKPPTQPLSKKKNPPTQPRDLSDEDFTKDLMDKDLLIDVKCLIIDTKISEGASSTVHEGMYKENPVSIKILEPPLGSPVSPELMKKFKQEVSMLDKGRHDYVVRLIGASLKPRVLIVTELMKGGSLKSYLWNSREATSDLQQSVRFALDISRALEHLHANNIIHRDLKPGNLVLAADKRSLKVTDFGLAHLGDDLKYIIYEVGNRRWMAPEMIIKKKEPVKKEPGEKTGDKSGEKTGEKTGDKSGEKTGEKTGEKSGDKSGDKSGEKTRAFTYTHKIDVYSFSIVLFELLTKETPPKNKRPSWSSVKAELRKDIGEDLVHLSESCWAEDPTVRPEFTEITVQLSDILEEMRRGKRIKLDHQ